MGGVDCPVGGAYCYVGGVGCQVGGVEIFLIIPLCSNHAVVVKGVLTMCQNMDEMISYALFCLLLAGRISKLAFSPDLVETRPLEEVAEICLKCIIDDK